MRACIGRTGPKRTFEVTKRDILRLSIALGDTNPLYRDEEYAKQTPHGGVIAPPFFITALTLTEEDLTDLEPSGLGKVMDLRMSVPTPGFPGAMATGRDIEFTGHIRPGDVITFQEKLVDVYEKQGRRGPMIFIIAERTYHNQRGELLVRERAGLIRHK
jgi:acyl dehydratase